VRSSCALPIIVTQHGKPNEYVRMKARWLHQAVLAGGVAAAVGAQEPQRPMGKWRSLGWETYTNPALTGAGLYLDVDVARDGSFRGTWAQYFCTVQAGAYGVAVYSCSLSLHTRKPVAGKFGPGRQGVIDLEQLGRSAFTWSAPSADELAIDLPKNWQGEDAVLYRARMTRDGKPRPVAASAAPDEGPPLSAVALYREFKKDENAALTRHSGKTLELEGRRGTLIALSDGGAAIHVPDGFQPRALVLYFRDLKEASGIGERAQFRFRCTLKNFDYQYVQMDDCSLVR
jgi:hypothetical protein